MKFSLILATVGRTAEVAQMVESLASQNYRHFELIVVDQNDDDRLGPLLSAYSNQFPILHLRTPQRGLSRARNLGLQHVTGDIVAFPDDDCWYPKGVLQFVHEQLSTHLEWDGMTGRSTDARGVDSAFSFSREDGRVDAFSVWQQAISYTIFLRRAVVTKVGLFDESLGVGAGTIFGSGEETDYMIRALQAKFFIHYCAQLIVHHPHPEEIIDERILKRTFSYGCGMGRVLAKHQYPTWFKLRAIIRPLGGAVLWLSRFAMPKAALHWNRFLGRMRGMREATPQSLPL